MTNHLDIFARIESGAHTGAFGQNQIPTPSEAQCNAGNYKVGRVSLHGLAIAIEQPRNSFRSGTDPSGKTWRSRLAAHYGYIRGTRGADGDAVDCFVGPWPQADTVYVINQQVGGEFDEHKCMLGFPSEDLARRAYLDSYDRGWSGLASLVPMSVPQFRWWLKHGNLSRPAVKDYLPFEGHEPMKTNPKVYWGQDASPVNKTLDQVLYAIRLDDADDGLVFDSLSAGDLREIAEGTITLDALVTPYAAVERTVKVLDTVMKRSGGEVKPLAYQITDPYKFRGVANVAVIWELSDGQTVSILLHNPDSSPNKLAPTDEMVSWKWLLNKKDITIVVAPEKGVDLNVREASRRIMRLAAKNSAAFQRANSARAERMLRIQALKDEIASMESTLAGLLHDIEVAAIEADARSRLEPDAASIAPTPVPEIGAFDPTTLANYGSVMADEALQLKYQDILDDFFQGRIYAVRAALIARGWFHPDGTDGTALHEYLAKGEARDGFDGLFSLATKKVGAGSNVVGVRYQLTNIAPLPFELEDDLSKSPDDIAAAIDARWAEANNARAEARATEEEAARLAAEESARSAEVTAPVNQPVSLTGNELGEFPDTEEGKKALRAAAREFLSNLRGKMIPCPAIGRDVEIRRRGIKETMAFSADPRKLKLVAAIEQLITTGVGGEKQPNYKPNSAAKQEVIAYYRLHNTAQLNGSVLAIEVIIEEDANGHLYYDFIVDRDAEKTKAALDCSSAADVSREPPNHYSGTGDDLILPLAGDHVNGAPATLDDAGGGMVINLFIEGEAPEVVEVEADIPLLTMADIASQLQALGWNVSLDDRSLIATIYGGDSGAIDVSVSWHFDEDGMAVDVDSDRLDPEAYPDAKAIARYVDEQYRYYDDDVAEATKEGGDFAGKTFEFAKSAMIVRDTARRLGGDTHFADFNYSMSEGLFDDAGQDESVAPEIPAFPYGICAQIIRDGNCIGRLRIDEGGEAVIYVGMAGATPVDGYADATSSHSRIIDMVEALFQLPTAAASDPAASPEPAVVVQPPEDQQKTADRALFSSVVNGTVANIGDPGLADQLEAAFMRHQDDPDMASLFEQAVDAYQAAMLAATANLA